MDRRLARTKRNIRRALLELTAKRSLNDITVTELSELADIDRKTFYSHYDTIHDVVYEMVQEVAEEVRALLAETEELSIREILLGLNTLMEKNEAFYTQIAGDTPMSFLKEACKDVLKQELRHAFFIRSGMTENAFEVCAEYVASGIIGIYTNWLAGRVRMPLEALTITASEAVENGWARLHGVNAQR